MHRRQRRLLLESLEDRSLLSTFSVINTDDAGPGSLRQAILDANDNLGPDEIHFSIEPGNPGVVHTIEPLTNLPATSAVTIDGTTQPGFVAGGPRLIELSGIYYNFPTPHLADDYGLFVNGDSTIKGLAINRFNFGIGVGGADNHIAGNYIGTDPTGSLPLPNRIGVLLGGSSNRLGTNGDGVNDEAERNIISGNTDEGVSGGGGVIAGNYIGTDATGMMAIANNFGIRGGDFTTEIIGNVISGNHAAGLYLPVHLVQGNLIGTDMTGNAALPNGIGIWTQYDYPVLIGGTTPAARNIISGNGGGMRMSAGSNATIQGNYIGRTLSGTDLGNTNFGIYREDGGSHLIGGRLPGEGNVISGNREGIGLIQITSGTDTIEGNQIVNNWNTGVVLYVNTVNQVIGGTDAGAGNTIAFNGTGIAVVPLGDSAPKQNRFVGNSIYGNLGLGIDLGGQVGGVTPNDPMDSDTGSNELQNFPELTAAASAASTRVQGSLHSTPSSTFVLDFYASSAADPSGYGEGERYLGSTTVTTDASGNASFNALISALSTAGEFITATATDAVGNTSEFSLAVESVTAIQNIAIDIQPESLNVDSNGTLTVVVFGAVDFDAANIDVSSVQFAGAFAWQSTLVDKNGDGRLDLQLKFRTQDTILDEIYAQLLVEDYEDDDSLDSTRQTTLVELTGETLDDALFSGSDSINLFLAGKSLRDLLNILFP